MYLAIDANFKLSCKEHGIKDVELMPGWGPCVEEENYQTHLKKQIENHEVIYKREKGKYCNIDYIILSTPVVPSWHINGHGSSCQSNFALAYLPGAGQTCGEEIETTWSSSNHLRPSTHEMGPASCHEVLNDQWIGWNFQKIIGFDKHFIKQYKEAVTMSEKHEEIFQKFNATFNTSITEEWEAQVIAWEMDHTRPNPYDEPEYRFELEEQQHLLKIKVSKLKDNPISKDLADLQDKRIALASKIFKWQELQLTYMPEIKHLIASNMEANTDEMAAKIELVPLYLPSELPAQLHTVLTIKKAAQIELKL
ncbi:hypothetical protein BDQ17DRAFT_1335001 [Cyathus striatus]|nr:hypothetical protein BDQ17DRAFT_1335001 [Cyathus striatus]